jgi:CDGSH-type Zn-finger protein
MTDVTITILDNGPYQVQGPITVKSASGADVELPGGRATYLCRCGGSTNKPFCDGTHSKIGFAAAEAAVAKDEAS